MARKSDTTNVNERIRASTIRLIGADGSQLGIMSTRDALESAREGGMDLVEVAPNGDPPVCRIMDYGKYKYQNSKKLQSGKKKSKSIQLKEIKLRPHTEEHDLNFKIRNLKKFLEKNARVKVSVIFRGREMSHMEIGLEILKRIAEDVSEVGTMEQQPTREGWRLTMVIVPK